MKFSRRFGGKKSIVWFRIFRQQEGQFDDARTFFDKLSNPKNRFVLTSEEEGVEMHCQKGNASFLHHIEFDWLDEILTH